MIAFIIFSAIVVIYSVITLRKRYSRKEKPLVISFYRKENKWYADLPFLPEDECLMVEGSDVFLDSYSSVLCDDSDNIELKIYTDYVKGYNAHFTFISSDIGGYTYKMQSDGLLLYLEFAVERNNYHYSEDNGKIWICKCMNRLYDKAPEELYII